MLILPPETERLAERLARAQGVEPVTAVQRALEESARAVGVGTDTARRPRRDLQAMAADAAAVAAMPLLDRRSAQQIVDEINDL